MKETVIASAYVKDGKVYGITNKGSKVQFLSGSGYAAAGVWGNVLMVVERDGLITTFEIRGSSGSISQMKSLHGARGKIGNGVTLVSFQPSGPDTFVMQLSDGTLITHTSATGTKIEGTPTRKATTPQVTSSEQKRSYKEEEDDEEDHEYTEGYAADSSGGFMEKINSKVESLFNDSIGWYWNHISVFVSALIGLVLSCLLLQKSNTEDLTVIAGVILGVTGVITGIGYKTRNVISKILVRSWIGIPLIGLGYFLATNIDQQVGGWTIVFGIVMWTWPAWPIIMVFLWLGVLLMGAFGAAAQRENKERMDRYHSR